MADRPDTQDRPENQAADADNISKSIQLACKKRMHRKKPDIQRQRGDKEPLEITAVEENVIFHAFCRNKMKLFHCRTTIHRAKEGILTVPFIEITSLKGWRPSRAKKRQVWKNVLEMRACQPLSGNSKP